MTTGRLRGLHRGQHLRRRRVCRRVDHHELDPCGGELRSCLAGSLGRVDEAGRDDLGAELAELALESRLVALEPFAEPFELRPVRGEADAEDADARPCVASRGRSLGLRS